MDSQRAPLLLLLAAVPVFFVALGANSIWDANEAFYVETPRQMVHSGDYISPSFGGEPRFNKPVLSYWLVAGAYRALGESVAVERLVIALSAMGILAGAVVIGTAIGSRATGILSALFLATAPRFVFFSRRILIDVLVTLCMTWVLGFLVLAERHPDKRRRFLALMYVAIGCGVLTKGPVALALPIAALLAWLVLERRLPTITSFAPFSGLAIVGLVVLPWYFAVYQTHGVEYIRQFLLQENVERFTSPFTTARHPLFFIPVLLADILMPWAPLVAVPLLTAWRREPDETPAHKLRRLLWCWVVIIVVAFSLSASKEDLYILPAIPAAAVLAADVVIRTGWGIAHRGVSWVMVAIALLCLALSGVIAEWFLSGYYAIAGAGSMAVLLALTGALALASLWRREFVTGCLTLVCGFVLLNYLFVARALPDLERLKPVPALAGVINERSQPGAVLAFFNMDLPSFVYYTNRPAVKVLDADSAARVFRDHGEVWMIAGTTGWDELKSRVSDVCIAARHPLFAAKASDILSRRPPPDVVLVTRGRGCTP